jgi:hypothetical protein
MDVPINAASFTVRGELILRITSASRPELCGGAVAFAAAAVHESTGFFMALVSCR